jgi:hypothetical protein
MLHAVRLALTLEAHGHAPQPTPTPTCLIWCAQRSGESAQNAEVRQLVGRGERAVRFD